MSDQSPPESENVQLPLISIIVDSYRNSDSLKYCLDSIKQQDYLQKLVIVIVNDFEKT
ncbi:MAG: glycosyltransferase [Nanoarchaeota archaeon]